MLEHNSSTVSFVCFFKDISCAFAQEKYEKLQEQIASLDDILDPVSLECCLKLPHIQWTHSLILILQGLDRDIGEFSDRPPSRCGLRPLKYPEL